MSPRCVHKVCMYLYGYDRKHERQRSKDLKYVDPDPSIVQLHIAPLERVLHED